MRDPIAVVAPAENPANDSAALRLLVGAVEKADADVKAKEGAVAHARDAATAARLAAGRQLIADRARWPTSGPRAKGWGQHLVSAGLAERTAREWMALAGYIEKISAPSRSGAEISRPTPLPPRREVARESRRVIVDHSQDAAGGGDEPSWKEPVYVSDGEAPPPVVPPCRLCGTVPGGKPTKLAATCKNGCGGIALEQRTGSASPAPTPHASVAPVPPPQQLAFDWSFSAVAVSRDLVEAGPAAALAMVLDIVERVPGLAEELRVRLAAQAG